MLSIVLLSRLIIKLSLRAFFNFFCHEALLINRPSFLKLSSAILAESSVWDRIKVPAICQQKLAPQVSNHLQKLSLCQVWPSGQHLNCQSTQNPWRGLLLSESTRLSSGKLTLGSGHKLGTWPLKTILCNQYQTKNCHETITKTLVTQLSPKLFWPSRLNQIHLFPIPYSPTAPIPLRTRSFVLQSLKIFVPHSRLLKQWALQNNSQWRWKTSFGDCWWSGACVWSEQWACVGSWRAVENDLAQSVGLLEWWVW